MVRMILLGPEQDWDALIGHWGSFSAFLTPWGVSGGQVGVKSYLSLDLSETWIVASFWGHNKIEMPNSLIGGDLLTPWGSVVVKWGSSGGQILFIIRFE